MTPAAPHPRRLPAVQLRATHRAIVLALVVVIVALLVRPAESHAYVVGGSRWPGATIRYYETLPASWDPAINAAVRSWNSSGANVRFVKVTRRSAAQFTMSLGRTTQGTGEASIGRQRGAYLRISGNPRRPQQLQPDDVAQTSHLISHELGHVLGLGHDERVRCGLMKHLFVSPCTSAWGPYQFPCRATLPDDVRGAIRLYGRARVTPKLPLWCYTVRATAAPGNLTVTGAGDTGAPATVTWTPPAGLGRDGSISIKLFRAGRCGSTLGTDLIETESLGPAETSWRDSSAARRPLGSWCLEVQALGLLGRPSVVIRRTITYSAVPLPPPTLGPLTENPGDFGDYSVAVTTSSDSGGVEVRALTGGGCATSLDQGQTVFVSPGDGGLLVLSGVPEGAVCLSFFETSVTDAGTSVAGAPTTREVTHVARPAPA